MRRCQEFSETWSNNLFLATTATFLVATGGTMLLIGPSDRSFPSGVRARRCAILEWQWRPAAVERIVDEWDRDPPAMWVGRRGLLLDTTVFIPLYSNAIAVACFGLRVALQFLHPGGSRSSQWHGVAAVAERLILSRTPGFSSRRLVGRSWRCRRQSSVASSGPWHSALR